MSTKLKIIIAAVLLTAVFTRHQIFNLLGIGKTQADVPVVAVEKEVEQAAQPEAETIDISVGDALYHWDNQIFDWMPYTETAEVYNQQLAEKGIAPTMTVEPIDVNWDVLTSILYQLRYFSQVDMEIMAPIFPASIQALDGKKVTVEGFVIPFDEEQEILSLSANPFAACFFCGKASPASVISMYLKNEKKRYKMDDFKKFSGTLKLNHDDPDQFYFILEEAVEE
ncbi:MAG: hypothetical protein AAF242_19360 [Bacteroidota bacterium]